MASRRFRWSKSTPEATKFLEVFSGLEHSTIGHVIYETIKIALIAEAGNIVGKKIRLRKSKLAEHQKGMEKAASEVLKKAVSDEKEATRIAVDISSKTAEEFEIYIRTKKLP